MRASLEITDGEDGCSELLRVSTDSEATPGLVTFSVDGRKVRVLPEEAAALVRFLISWSELLTPGVGGVPPGMEDDDDQY